MRLGRLWARGPRYMVCALVISFIFGLLIGIKFSNREFQDIADKPKLSDSSLLIHTNNFLEYTTPQPWTKHKLLPERKPLEISSFPNTSVQIFYYLWYGSVKTDGHWIHWNHPRLSHWDSRVAESYNRKPHEPPEDIASSFYPLLGPYSSGNITVMDQHMRWIRDAKIGTLIVSWYPPGKADPNGEEVDKRLLSFLDAAAFHNLKVALHIEPWYQKSSNMSEIRKSFHYIMKRYGKHKALYRYLAKDKRMLPVFYMYDSYRTHWSLWSQLLTPGGTNSIRGTSLDAIFLGLYVHRKDCDDMARGGFDGAYTYFAAEGFTYGSSSAQWSTVASLCHEKGLMFVPSVGPGYKDTSVRPWNGMNTHQRNGGVYYRDRWLSAIQSKPDLISITSFNEWHEGTQIEPAVPRPETGIRYDDYSPRSADFYLKLTRTLVEKFFLHQSAR